MIHSTQGIDVVDNMSSLKENLQSSIVTCQKAKDSKKLGVLRQLSSALKQFEIDNRTDITEQDSIQIFSKLVKQRKESIAQFEKANRQDLVDQEVYELALIQEFLPKQLSETELQKLIKDAIATSSASSVKDMGKVLGILKPKILGKADRSKVSAAIKQSLSS